MSDIQPNLTFAIIKPDAVRGGQTGNIIQRMTDQGFKIRALKMVHITQGLAEGFYAVHRERPFFNDLVAFMTSGPSVVLALEKANAVQALARSDGARPTRPKRRRARFAAISARVCKRTRRTAPTSPENAKIELSYFFNATEFC